MSIIVLCLLTTSKSYMKKIDALPIGVERVEISNWTKTREVDEIGGDEKKLNSEKFDHIKNINMGDDENNIEEFSNLYQEQEHDMRTLSKVSQLNYDNDKIAIKGNKILRSKIKSEIPIYAFNYSSMKTWVGSDINVNWDDGTLGSKILTWPCYTEVLEDKYKETPIEWRMIEGNFKLSKDQISKIMSKEVQPVIGIETQNQDNFKLICPFEDIMNVFINKNFTSLNYSSRTGSYKFRENNSTKINEYTYIRHSEHEKYCDKEEDNVLSQHTNNNHIDFNMLSTTSTSASVDVNNKNEKYYKMIGDISQYIKSSTTEYTISLLIGKIAVKDQNAFYNTGGISKINLYLVNTPKVDVNIKPYKISNGNKIYLDENYKFSYNEKILFDVEIANSSNDYDFSNISFNLNLIKNKTSNITDTEVLSINEHTFTYKDENISDNIQLYINKNNTLQNIESLSQIKRGETLLISSDSFEYMVTQYNTTTEKIDYNFITEFKYLNNYTFYKYENQKRLQVKQEGGKLNITVNSKDDNYFYLKLIGEENSSNIKVKSNQTYIISNLDYDKEYKLLLINSSYYNPQNSETFTLKNTSGNNTKSITINVRSKDNNYFTQRKTDKIKIDR